LETKFINILDKFIEVVDTWVKKVQAQESSSSTSWFELVL